MNQASDDTSAEMAESASIGQAGEPRHADQVGGPQRAQAPPTEEELDARQEAFSRPRKPMGPVENDNAPTIPEGIPEE